jgi:hypothetical protein
MPRFAFCGDLERMVSLEAIEPARDNFREAGYFNSKTYACGAPSMASSVCTVPRLE